MYVKNIRLRKKSYNYKTKEDICMKFWHHNSKASIYVMQKFQIHVFKHVWEISRQRVSWPGRLRPRRFITDIGSTLKKNKIFCSMNHRAKINISRLMMLFCFLIWLWQEALCVDRRHTSRRVSLLRPLITHASIFQYICENMCKFSNLSCSTLTQDELRMKLQFSH